MHEELLRKALVNAIYWHHGQTDKLGLPYILHPLAVAASPTLKSNFQRACAALHDVVEDCGVDVRVIIDMFGVDVGLVVDLLTRKSDVSDEEYYARIKANGDALAVKLADIRHNISPGRFDRLDTATKDRLHKKYGKAIALLTGT